MNTHDREKHEDLVLGILKRHAAEIKPGQADIILVYDKEKKQLLTKPRQEVARGDQNIPFNPEETRFYVS